MDAGSRFTTVGPVCVAIFAAGLRVNDEWVDLTKFVFNKMFNINKLKKIFSGQ